MQKNVYGEVNGQCHAQVACAEIDFEALCSKFSSPSSVLFMFSLQLRAESRDSRPLTKCIEFHSKAESFSRRPSVKEKEERRKRAAIATLVDWAAAVKSA
jgi:hypothetical protein